MLHSVLTNISLRQKLLFSFVILVLLPLSAISFISYQIFRASLFDNISTSTAEVLRQTGNNIDHYLRQLAELTERPYFDPNALGIMVEARNGRLSPDSDAYLSDFFKRILVPRNDTEGIFLYPMSGSAYFAARNSAHQPDFDPSKTTWYREAVKRKGQIVLTPTHVQEQIGYQPARVFSLTRVINDFSTRQPLGVLTFDFNYTELQKIRDDVALFADGRLGIYTKSGEAVLSGGGDSDEHAAEYLRLPHHKYRLLNDYWMASYTVPYSDWVVLYQVPVHVLNEKLETIKTYIVLIAACGLLLASAFYGWIVVRLTDPLLSLRKMMTRVGAGDFSVQMPQREVRDEIGQITAHFVKVTGRLQETIEATHVLQLKRKQAQLNALRTQINPHFLYNTLESIYMMAIMNEDEETARMIGLLGDFFKKTLRLNADFVTLREEVGNFQVYWELQRVRFARRIEVAVDYPDEYADALIVPLILQPLVENAISHGLKENAGRISILIFPEGRRLCIRVTDSGQELTEAKLLDARNRLNEEKADEPHAAHIGLRNIHERIRLVCGDEYGLEIDRAPEGGLMAKAVLPIKLKEEHDAPDSGRR